MIDVEHFMNPEGHATVDPQFYSDRREIIDPPVVGEPIEDRPIELIYNNVHPFALAEVRIFGKVLQPANYTIDAQKGLITLVYHYIRVNVTVSNEDGTDEPA